MFIKKYEIHGQWRPLEFTLKEISVKKNICPQNRKLLKWNKINYRYSGFYLRSTQWSKHWPKYLTMLRRLKKADVQLIYLFPLYRLTFIAINGVGAYLRKQKGEHRETGLSHCTLILNLNWDWELSWDAVSTLMLASVDDCRARSKFKGDWARLLMPPGPEWLLLPSRLSCGKHKKQVIMFRQVRLT